MSLNIGGASIGYDANGMVSLIDTINLQIVPDACNTLNTQVTKTREAIDTVWVGASAEAFKEKLSNDNKEVCNALRELAEGIEGSLNNVGVNVEELDNEIAKKFGGGTDYFVSTADKGKAIIEGAAMTLANPSYAALGVFRAVDGITGGQASLYATTAGVGVLEGIGSVCEGLVDGADVVLTGALVLPYKFLINNIEYDGVEQDRIAVDEALKKEQDFIKKNYVEDWANSIYESTGADKLDNFKTVHNVSKASGEIAAAIGIGLIAPSALGATAAEGVTLVSGGQMFAAGVAGISKVGETASNVWNSSSSASFEKGFAYGVASGSLAAAQVVALGATTNKFNWVKNSEGKVVRMYSSEISNALKAGEKIKTCAIRTGAAQIGINSAVNVYTDFGDTYIRTAYNDSSCKNYYLSNDSSLTKVYKVYAGEHGNLKRGIIESTVQGVVNTGISNMGNLLYKSGYYVANKNTEKYSNITHSTSEKLFKSSYDKSISRVINYYVDKPMEKVCKSISGEDAHFIMRYGDDTSERRFINTDRFSS